MTDLLVIFGPPAVGKMTVGQHVARLTGFKLFHNHMTIDLLTKIFPFRSKPFRTLCDEFRRRVIEEAAAYPECRGIVFTYVWDLDDPFDRQVVDTYKAIIEKAGGRTVFAELAARFDERIARNKTDNRLAHKNKGDVKSTEANIRDWEGRHRMNTRTGDDFFYPDLHCKIENSDLPPDRAAEQIVQTFNLPRLANTPLTPPST